MHRTALALALAILAFTAGSKGQVSSFVPVTDAMLENPDPNDWINWRRTQDGWGYSPLQQINRQTASRLTPSWSVPLSKGGFEPTPIVYKGIMYVPSPLAGVVALDAASGRKLWEFRHDMESQPKPPYYDWARFTQMRNLAIYGDKIILATRDARLIALNAATGAVVWNQVVANYMLGYRYSSGPIIARGVIVAGMAGCERYKHDVCFITGHDPETGRQLWRTNTVAGPGTPGGDTWSDLPLEFRAGGDAWIPGTYDPVTNLVYWSTAQAKPWARASRGTDGAALYTNAVLALEPATGRMRCYNQFLPGDSHDMDEVFESILIDRGPRKSLFKMGKLGILWELDRTSGAFVQATDLGYQNIVDVDRKSGRVTYRAGMIAKLGEAVTMCPGTGGVRNWRSPAYHPETQALYIPVILSCQTIEFHEVPRVVGGDGRPYGDRTLGAPAHPASPDQRGMFVAMDVGTGEVRWKTAFRGLVTSAALTTAGGLAIVGDADRTLYVHDVTNGDLVYKTTLPGNAAGFPITYAAGGQQYIAVATISGGENAITAFRVAPAPASN